MSRVCIMTDFEQGLFGAFPDVFINVHIRDGFFDFGQIQSKTCLVYKKDV